MTTEAARKAALAASEKAEKDKQSAELILYCKNSPRSPERVLGSFVLADGANNPHIIARQVEEINRLRASGLDATVAVFRVAREPIKAKGE